ncbi:MAG TPA: glycosyltransferase, partial [Pirellulales bacterium]
MALLSAPAATWSTKLPVVALVAADLEPRGRSRYPLRLNAGLASAGFQPLVVCRQICDPEDRRLLPRAIERPELKVPIWGWWIEGELIDELKAKKVEVVHAVVPSAASFARRLADALEAPLVVSVHDFLRPKDRFRFTPKHG